MLQAERFTNILNYRHFNHPIQFIFKYAVGLFNLTQWEAVRDEWRGVYSPLFNKVQNLFAIATVYAACLESEIFAVHIGKREHHTKKGADSSGPRSYYENCVFRGDF